MCSYASSGPWPDAVGFLLLGLVFMVLAANPKVRPPRPWSSGLLAIGLLLLVLAVWIVSTDPFAQPSPCSD